MNRVLTAEEFSEMVARDLREAVNLTFVPTKEERRISAMREVSRWAGKRPGKLRDRKIRKAQRELEMLSDE